MMNSWRSVGGLVLLSLCCFVAHEADLCQCAPATADGGSSEETIWKAPSTGEQREKLSNLTETKCKVKEFERYKFWTISDENISGASAEELGQLELVKQMLAECPFVDDLKVRLAKLGEDSKAKLASLVENIERGMKEAFITEKRWGRPSDLYSEGVLSFLGEQGVFVSGRELGASDLSREFYQKVESLCWRVQGALEPTAEIFRLFSNVRAQVFPGVDESLFSWADASELCYTVALSRNDAAIHDYAGYLRAFKAERLPGDPRWKEAKAKFEQRVSAILSAADNGGCKWETLVQLDGVVREESDFRPMSERDGSLEKRRAEYLSQCEETFEQLLEFKQRAASLAKANKNDCEGLKEFDSIIGELDQYKDPNQQDSFRLQRNALVFGCRAIFGLEFQRTINILDSSESARAVALVDAIYGKKPLGSSGADINRGILQFMKQQDSASFRKWKRIQSEQFNAKFDQLVGNLATSVENQLNPVLQKFRGYLTEKELGDSLKNEALLDWIERSNMLKRVLSPTTKEDVYSAYKHCRFGTLLCGI